MTLNCEYIFKELYSWHVTVHLPYKQVHHLLVALEESTNVHLYLSAYIWKEYNPYVLAGREKQTCTAGRDRESFHTDGMYILKE